MYIYIIINKINGKSYIGKTTNKDPGVRIKAHLREVKAKRRNYPLYNAIRKYGWKNFLWKVIDECDSEEELNEKEVRYIKEYNTFNNGYNLTVGGDGTPGRIFNEEERKKISDRVSGSGHPMYGKTHPNKGKKIHTKEHKEYIGEFLRNINIGRKHSDETKKKWSEQRKGRVVSEETRKKLSEKSKGRKHSEKTKDLLREINTGKILSDETKKKISESSKGKKNNILQAVRMNKCFWEVYHKSSKDEKFLIPSLRRWCLKYNFCYSWCKKAVAKNNRYKGYFFKKIYIDDIEDLNVIDFGDWE